MDAVVRVTNLSKSFELAENRSTSLKQFVVNIGKGNKKRRQVVLRELGFEVNKGDFFGIVGRNGSGKSTLLKILAGVYSPDEGAVEIEGRLTPFIELGVGFNPELTGRDNVYLSASLLGYTHKQVDAMYSDIVAFAELEEHMDKKLKNYSSGMQVRLAFSIAIRANSEVLLLDEVLAVGDVVFQQKCFDYFRDLKRDGKTVVFVSHDMNAVKQYCTRALYLKDGKIVKIGKPSDIADLYNDDMIERLDVVAGIAPKDSPQAHTKQVEITSITCTSESGKHKKSFEQGEMICIKVQCRVHRDVEEPIIGVTITPERSDAVAFAVNSVNPYQIGLKGVLNSGQCFEFDVRLKNQLSGGRYVITPAAANSSGTLFYHKLDRVESFTSSATDNNFSIFQSDYQATVKEIGE